MSIPNIIQSIADFMWLVGILEGEGYFGVYYRKQGCSPECTISVEMNDEDVIARVSCILNMNYTRTGRGTYKVQLRRKKDLRLWCKALVAYMGKRRAKAVQKMMEALG